MICRPILHCIFKNMILVRPRNPKESIDSLVRHTIGPTQQWSDTPLIRHTIGPTNFRRPYITRMTLNFFINIVQMAGDSGTIFIR